MGYGDAIANVGFLPEETRSAGESISSRRLDRQLVIESETLARACSG
jgi:hypothetical protein